MQRHLTRASHQLRRLLCTRVAPPGDGPNHRSIMALDANTIRPFVQPNAFIAPSASVIGSVVVNDKAAVMYGAVIRGDLALIHVGALTVIGENCVLTAGAVDGVMSPSDAVSSGLPIEPELFVGDYCLIGANVTLRGCNLEGDNVVGHGSSIAEGAHLGRYAVLQPGSFVGEGVRIGEAEIWAGSPAMKVGEVSADGQVRHRQDAVRRFAVTSRHAYEFLPHGFGYLEKEALAKRSKATVKQ